MSKISLLPLADPPTGAEIVPVIQDGVTKQMRYDTLAALFVAAAHAMANYRPTFAQAIADFAVDEAFSCDETGALAIYRRIAAAPGYALILTVPSAAQVAAKADIGHVHAIGDVTGLQTALNGKAAVAHGHSIADFTGILSQADNAYDVLAYVQADGVMEIGRYIDFHIADNDGVDNATRLEAQVDGTLRTTTAFQAPTLQLANGNHRIYGLDASNLTIRIGAAGPYLGIGTPGGNAIRFDSANIGAFQFAFGGTVTTVINTAGNIGVGTTDPKQGLHVVAAEPAVVIEESDAGADAKIWRTYSVVSQFRIGAVNDAFDAGSDAYVITRTGYVPDQHIWYAGDSERMRLTTNGLAVGSNGTDYGRAWRAVFKRDQNAVTEIGVINGSSGVDAAARISRITGTGNSFCDWSLTDAGGNPYDLFNYGAAVQRTDWSYNSVVRMRLENTGLLRLNGGAVPRHANTAYGSHNVTVSTANPSGGADGDVWYLV